MSKNSVGLQDIASRLNLSVSTVSRGLRDASGIHPETRSRIIQEAEAIGYVGQQPRAGLEKIEEQRKRNVLILTGGSTTPGGYLEGLSQAASRYGVSLHIHHCPQESCSELFLGEKGPVSLLDGTCDGVILVYRWPSEIVETLVRRIPVVSIMHDYPGLSIDLVGLDTAGGVNALVRHLRDWGHKRMGFFGLMPEVSWSRARFGAFAESVTYYDIPLEMEHIVRFNKEVLSHGESYRDTKAIDQVVAGIKSGVKAWLAADDFSGYCLSEELMRRGMRIPEDVSITGFHFHDFMRSSHAPALTSTLVDNIEIGRLALKLMLQRIDRGGKTVQMLVPAELKSGQSTSK
ncbi:LacI family DNA-binding transcriptional regulator [Cerasicoccus arenae]|nr:LacI family DNA-binding transcriptional regulator [Cerasicoccus arenae]MBK1859263.1 LacI family DNA-binding transcriptional regulator [Cerasicoccus arenae]